MSKTKTKKKPLIKTNDRVFITVHVDAARGVTNEQCLWFINILQGSTMSIKDIAAKAGKTIADTIITATILRNEELLAVRRMDEYELFAVEWFLSCFHDDEDNASMTFQQVLNNLEKFSVWQPFENHDIDLVAELMQDMVDNLKANFVPKVQHA